VTDDILKALEEFQNSDAGRELGASVDACAGSIDEPNLRIDWQGERGSVCVNCGEPCAKFG